MATLGGTKGRIAAAALCSVLLMCSLYVLAGTPSQTKRPNVILISLDTLRADHLGTYGYQRPTSPFLDRFASGATLFRNAISPAAWTLPAHVSIMLSQYPAVHGVTNALRRIDPDAMTLAALLRDNGYATAGFVTAGLLEARHGFGSGFQLYERVLPGTAPTVNHAALAWLKQSARPYFLFLHYYDVHEPYARRKADARSYCAPDTTTYAELVARNLRRFLVREGIEPTGLSEVDPQDSRRLHGLTAALIERQGASERLAAPLRAAVTLNGDLVSAEERACLIGLYDDGIGYLDGQLEELFGQLAAMQALENSIVIITSDHGEGLYDHHAFRGHARYVDQSIIHVPLIVKFPAQRAGASVDETVSTLDLFPTILERVGIARRDGVQGRSLVPLMNGEWSGEPVAVLSASHEDEALNAVVVDGWKLIRGPHGAQLFALATDPGEQKDRAGEDPGRVAQLDVELQRLLAPPPGRRAAPGHVDLDPASREQLRALGYLD